MFECVRMHWGIIMITRMLTEGALGAVVQISKGCESMCE